MIQQPEFDFAESQRLAEIGMSYARDAARVEVWINCVNAWFNTLVSGTEFTSDDLVRANGLPDSGANRVNAVGAWFSGKAKQHKIRFSGQMVKSQRVDRHRGLQRVWIVV
jgi:hypothetical protein